MPLTIVTRELWRAAPVNCVADPPVLPVQYIFYSCTRTDSCRWKGDCRLRVEKLQADAMLVHRIGDIRYKTNIISFLVGGDGKVYEGRGWKAQPHLPPKYRHMAEKSIYIGFLGMFNKRHCPDEMLIADLQFIDFYVAYEYIARRYLEYHLDDRVYFVN